MGAGRREAWRNKHGGHCVFVAVLCIPYIRRQQWGVPLNMLEESGSLFYLTYRHKDMLTITAFLWTWGRRLPDVDVCLEAQGLGR